MYVQQLPHKTNSSHVAHVIQLPLILNWHFQEQNEAAFLWVVDVFLLLHCKYNNRPPLLLR